MNYLLKKRVENIKPALVSYLGRFSFCLIFSFVVLGTPSYSQSLAPKLKENFYLVHDFKEDWSVFDEQFKAHVPYIENRHNTYHSFSLFMALGDLRGYKLLFYSKDQNYLFLNGKLQTKLPTNNWFEWDIDSLYLANKNQHKIFFTLYSKLPGLDTKTLVVANKINKADLAILESNNNQTLKYRKFGSFKNVITIIAFFLLLSIVFLKNLEKNIFKKYINLTDLFTISKRFDTFLNFRLFEIGNMLYLIILSLSVAFIVLYVDNAFFKIIPKVLAIENNPSFFNLFSQFINLGFIIFVFFILKYIFLSFVSNLYKIDKIVNLHYFKILQSIGIFTLFLVSIITVLYVSPLKNILTNPSYFIWTISLFYIFRTILLYFVINKAISVKILYLFTYLCIVEIIPLFIGIRLAI